MQNCFLPVGYSYFSALYRIEKISPSFLTYFSYSIATIEYMQRMVASLLVISILFGLIVGFLFFIQKNTTKSPPTVDSKETITPTLPPRSSSTLPKNGSVFIDPKGAFSLTYPTDFTLDQQNNGQYTRLYKRGETQRGQTEMYDGVIMTFEQINLGGQSLNSWIDTKINATTIDGTVSITKQKEPITVHEYPGFTYTTRGLGSTTYLFIQKEPTSQTAMGITLLVADPNHTGYQKQVDTILSSLTLLK